jgi:hypothetical protein
MVSRFLASIRKKRVSLPSPIAICRRSSSSASSVETTPLKFM